MNLGSYRLYTKLLLPGARPGSKTNLVVAKLFVHVLRNENLCRCVGYFTSPGIDTGQSPDKKGPSAFNVSSERHRDSQSHE